MSDATILLGTAGNREAVSRCLDSLHRFAGDCDVVIVDNAVSEIDGTRELVCDFAAARGIAPVLLDETLIFSGTLNRLVEQPIATPWVVFMHSDTVLTRPDWRPHMKAMIEQAQQRRGKEVAFVAPIRPMHIGRMGSGAPRICLTRPTFMFALAKTRLFAEHHLRFGPWREDLWCNVTLTMEDAGSFWIDFLQVAHRHGTTWIDLKQVPKSQWPFDHPDNPARMGTAWFRNNEIWIEKHRTKDAAYWQHKRKETKHGCRETC